MSDEPALYYSIKDLRSWTRVVIGLPILMGVLLFLALVGWICFGCPAGLAPQHWIHLPLLLPFLCYVGAMFSVFALVILWFVGFIAFLIGGVASTAWRRFHDQSKRTKAA